ncbi:MAG: hypothetical protein ACPG80_00960 [Rickettsiales bacterium]
MLEFMQSELGYRVGWICMVLGVADLGIGWLWLRRKAAQEQLEQSPGLRSALPKLIWVDVVLIGFGAVSVWMHL